jgi:predicted RNA-binding Zn-ribbon protein involved in translation (DUF1610 family)
MFNLHFGCKHMWQPPRGRVQYCSKCGDMKLAPCEHHWKPIHMTDSDGFIMQVVQQCTACGEVEIIREQRLI